MPLSPRWRWKPRSQSDIYWHARDKRSEADPRAEIHKGNTRTNGDLEEARRRLTDDTQNSGIQVTVSTSNDRGLWFKLWSRTVVSLPLCKAREQNTRRRSTNWRILQNQALMGRVKVKRWNHSPRPQWKSKERRRSQVHRANSKVLKIHRLKDSTQDKRC